MCGEEGHISGACPASYSARASADVELAGEPSQSGPEPMVEEPRSPSPDEVAHQVEQDFLAAKECEVVSGNPEVGPSRTLPISTSWEAGISTVEKDLNLSSDSESDTTMSDVGGRASEPPPKDPPTGEDWFDLCEGVESDPQLKRSASGEVSDQGVHPSMPPAPNINEKARSETAIMTGPLSLMTLNVNGMWDSRKRSRIFQFCKSLGVDFVFLQETHIVNEDVYAWSYECGGGLHASLGSVSSCRSVILVSPRWTSLVGKVDHEGRVICITIKHPCGSFILCNVYAPNQPTDRRDFVTTLPSFVPGCAPCILAGDLNCVPDTQFDRMSTCTYSNCGVGIAELDMFTKNHDMVDVWRVQHPGLAVFTWHRADDTDASRLDRVYSPPALSPSDCEVVACPISDPDAVTVSFQPPESWPAGRGFWKMNTYSNIEACLFNGFRVVGRRKVPHQTFYS
ncbi:hypothetical protein HOLleu_03304 [Holothuria leucospilota]|uniref:exodeoxyribonuclease III n=1 Tax=Holothuria leucospilota TaxID=206669 RepID=A0A9Q1CSP4_HOLLE|nr:hypothetical protein HOLleu_03304 [Holothuria leucospilota]